MKETDARAGGADHLGESFLAHFRDHRYRLGFLAEVGQQQEKPGEAFFAGVEEVIHQVRFHANVPGKQVGEKAFGKFRFLMEQVYHRLLVTRMIVPRCTAVAVDMRTGWPARQPSPKKLASGRMATTASLPRLDTTVSFTLPLWM